MKSLILMSVIFTVCLILTSITPLSTNLLNIPDLNKVTIVSPGNITKNSQRSRNKKTQQKNKQDIYLQDQPQIWENIMKDETVSLDINGIISKVILSTRSEGLD